MHLWQLLCPWRRHVSSRMPEWNTNCHAGMTHAWPMDTAPLSLLNSEDECWPWRKLKQRCRDLVWWPGLDKDIEQLVGDFAPCLVSGKTGPPIPTPLGSLPWPTQLWDHIQLDICDELYDVPHNLCFLVVVYDLHLKWPEGTSVGSRPVPSLAF